MSVQVPLKIHKSVVAVRKKEKAAEGDEGTQAASLRTVAIEIRSDASLVAAIVTLGYQFNIKSKTKIFLQGEPLFHFTPQWLWQDIHLLIV